ncbi:MAG TPA: tRNA lysidine(34) synthetase TilS [Pirellulales bacterium]|nr:tRNA lysidine(34) synthetase TilS [Pirellulales bacterium]
MAREAAPAVAALESRLRQLWPPDDWCDVTVLAAVSGGADSVALLRGLQAVRTPGPGRLVVAHFNHALRAEADDDERFVRQLAERLGLQCVVARAERPAGPPKPASGMEEAARHARYDFLRATATEFGARYVATAHTADDQAETVLHRILRGTGIGGLSGMRRARSLREGVTLIRPLLTVRRAELVAYLAALGQPFREDATNLERRFTRNRLRHELLPQLAEQYNGQIADALLRLGRLAGEAQEVIDGQVKQLLRRAVRWEAERLVFDCTELAEQPRYVLRELLIAAWRRQGWREQAMGFDVWEALADSLLATAASGRTAWPMLPGRIAVARHGDLLVLSVGGDSAGKTSLSA